MRTIYKYFLSRGLIGHACPVDAKILLVDLQDGSICIWMEVDNTNPVLETRTFRVYGTGQEIAPDGQEKLTHVGSVQEVIAGDSAVCHVYEITQEENNDG